jgi:hypothetical protein
MVIASRICSLFLAKSSFAVSGRHSNLILRKKKVQRAVSLSKNPLL